MARRRRGGGPTLTTIYWIDIPAQVVASADGDKANALLPDRFQHAIDRAAAVADKTETEAYVAEWRKVTAPLDGELQPTAEAEAARLDAAFPRERLEALVANGGTDPEMGTDPELDMAPEAQQTEPTNDTSDSKAGDLS